MSGERLYESAAVWDQQLQLGQRNLITAICDHWPDGVRSVLDVGCGDGKITHALAERTGAVFHGFDGSREALSRLRVPGTLGDVRQLPFGDHAFDLVMTTDVFEHLPDEVEQDAWHELFRVARDWVFFAVPFREELLDATARCQACGAHYHVNWHQRSYDSPDLTRRAPAGWKVSGVVLSGEPWSPMLPPETAYRRMELDEWSGWSDAVCPACGASGQPAELPGTLTPEVARALGLCIYAQISSNQFVRSHSELLIVFSRVGNPLVVREAGAIESEERLAASWTAAQGLARSLDPYPQVAKMVPAIDGGFIAQFPVYPGAHRRLRFVGRPQSIESVAVSIEDGNGSLFNGEVTLSAQGTLDVELPREPKAGYYGLLVRLPAIQPFASIALPGGPLVRWVRPVTEKCGYFAVEGTKISVQVTQLLWLDRQAIHSRLAPWRGGTHGVVVHALASTEKERDRLGKELQAYDLGMEATACDRLKANLAACAQQLEAVSSEWQLARQECDRLTADLAARAQQLDEVSSERQLVADERDQLLKELAEQKNLFAELEQCREVRMGRWVRPRLGLRGNSVEK